jgi:hypothetical protein
MTASLVYIFLEIVLDWCQMSTPASAAFCVGIAAAMSQEMSAVFSIKKCVKAYLFISK